MRDALAKVSGGFSRRCFKEPEADNYSKSNNAVAAVSVAGVSKSLRRMSKQPTITLKTRFSRRCFKEPEAGKLRPAFGSPSPGFSRRCFKEPEAAYRGCKTLSVKVRSAHRLAAMAVDGA